jgi:hypothetical protein
MFRGIVENPPLASSEIRSSLSRYRSMVIKFFYISSLYFKKCTYLPVPFKPNIFYFRKVFPRVFMIISYSSNLGIMIISVVDS